MTDNQQFCTASHKLDREWQSDQNLPILKAMAAALFPSQRAALATAARPPQATCTPCTPSTSSPSSAAAWRHQRHHGRMQMHGMPAMRIAAPSHGASIRRFASSSAGSAAAGEDAAGMGGRPYMIDAQASQHTSDAAANGFMHACPPAHLWNLFYHACTDVRPVTT